MNSWSNIIKNDKLSSLFRRDSIIFDKLKKGLDEQRYDSQKRKLVADQGPIYMSLTDTIAPMMLP